MERSVPAAEGGCLRFQRLRRLRPAETPVYECEGAAGPDDLGAELPRIFLCQGAADPEGLFVQRRGLFILFRLLVQIRQIA